jgi:N-acetylmuramoyl-L-alanine amidase CwlA
MDIKQSLIDKSRYDIKCPYTMNYQYLTYHNTDNSASSLNEVNNVKRVDNNAKVSFHIAVDDKEAIQVIPTDRNAWAAGDGTNGTGNRQSIHVEICYNELGANNSKFKQAENNAVQVCAKLLYDKKLGIDRLKPHKYWSGKNCPSTTNHKEFENKVKIELEKLNKPSKVSFKNGDYSGHKARVTTDVLNVRCNRGTNFEVIGQVKKGQIVSVNYCVDKWISVEGFSGNKGLGYVHTDYLELI